jgi:hypothetical protein
VTKNVVFYIANAARTALSYFVNEFRTLRRHFVWLCEASMEHKPGIMGSNTHDNGVVHFQLPVPSSVASDSER